MNTIEVSFNGERLKTQATSLQALLLERGYALQNAFACALNNDFVPRPQWPQCRLQQGDRVDVVSPITGG